MPSPVNIRTTSGISSQTIATTTETVVATLTGINVDRIQRRVRLSGLVNILVGTGGTGVTLRIRRTSVTGTVVEVAQLVTAAAGSTYSLGIDAYDQPGEVAGGIYVLTVAVAAATANSTVNYAHLNATIY